MRNRPKAIPAPATEHQATSFRELEALALVTPEQHIATDVANARRIAEHFGDVLAYTSAGWLCWDGKRWALDDVQTTGKAVGLGALILHEAAEALKCSAVEPDPARRKQGAALAEELAKWSRQTESAHRIEAALSLARSKLQRPVEDFDGDPFLLNVQNGVLDLRTGKLLPHDPALRLTKLAGCAFDPAAECLTWLRFLDDVFMGDMELVAFMQRLCGYFLTGSTRDHVLPIGHGTGTNGKTTLMRTLEAVLGEYARPAPAGMFEARHDGRDDQHVALLWGLRLVVGHETERGSELREGFIKQATGGDVLSGRRLYGEPFDFAPTHKLMLATNHRPRVRGTDLGIWRRILLVPFEARFTAEAGNLDPDMLDKLLAELPGILSWALDGCVEWQRLGLNPPAKVRVATDEYRKSEDLVQQFVDERCELDDAAATPSREVYGAFTAWCEGQGIKRPINQRSVTEELKRFEVLPGKGGERPLRGIRVK